MVILVSSSGLWAQGQEGVCRNSPKDPEYVLLKHSNLAV